jgi:hypothetical protein
VSGETPSSQEIWRNSPSFKIKSAINQNKTISQIEQRQELLTEQVDSIRDKNTSSRNQKRKTARESEGSTKRKQMQDIQDKVYISDANAILLINADIAKLELDHSIPIQFPPIIDNAQECYNNTVELLTADSLFIKTICGCCSLPVPCTSKPEVTISEVNVKSIPNLNLLANNIDPSHPHYDKCTFEYPTVLPAGHLNGYMIDEAGLINKDNATFIQLCSICNEYLGKKKTPPYALANQFYLGKPPSSINPVTNVLEPLPELTWIEKKCLSRGQ